MCLRSYGSSRDCYYCCSLGASFDNPNQWGTLSLVKWKPLRLRRPPAGARKPVLPLREVSRWGLWKNWVPSHDGGWVWAGAGAGGPGAESQLSCRSDLPCQVPFTVSKRKKQSSTKVISCLSVNCFPPGRVWGDPGGTVCLRRNTRNVCGCADVRASHQNYQELNRSLGG